VVEARAVTGFGVKTAGTSFMETTVARNQERNEEHTKRLLGEYRPGEAYRCAGNCNAPSSY
jgi:hypothetical protein